MALLMKKGYKADRDFINDKIVEFNSQQIPFTQKEKFTHLDYVIKDIRYQITN